MEGLQKDLEAVNPAGIAAPATRASQEAIASADAAAILILAATEAAARCVRARDDAATAAKLTTWCDVLTLRRPYGKSANFHKKARKDATAAALAAREGALRCAAASRCALSAASVARKAAVLPGTSEEAATEALQAADLCVADTAATIVADAAAGNRAVPRADRAALKAREAAASCDKALTDPVAEADKDFLEKMRGWLMAVAALFVGIAFQAVSHPSAGMSFDRCHQPREVRDAPSPTPGPPPSAAPAPPPSADSYGKLACLYMSLNMATTALAVTLLVALMIMKKSTRRFALLYIQLMLATIASFVSGSFIISVLGNQRIHSSSFQQSNLQLFVACTFLGLFHPIFFSFGPW